MDDGLASFPTLFKNVVDRICERDGLLRATLAEKLGVHPNTLSAAAYKGEISLDFVERIAKLAGASASELVDLELAWLRLRASRPRDMGLRRSVQMTAALIEELAAVNDWLEKRGLLNEFRRSRRGGDPLARLARERLQDR